MTIVIDVDRHEQPVRLCTPGFESCVVVAPGFMSDLNLLRDYGAASRARAGAFVDELLATSLRPASSTARVRALPEADRARLRLALVTSAGCEHEWKSLYGCHLTADERLFAVMYWRRQRQLSAQRRMAAEHEASLSPMRASLASDIQAKFGVGDSFSSSSALKLALGGAQPKLNFSELVSPGAFGAFKALEEHAAWSRKFTKMFENPLAGALANINRTNSMFSATESLRALTEGTAFGPTNSIASAFAASVSMPRVDASLMASFTGKPFKQMMELTSGETLMPWKVPGGVTDMLGMWKQDSNMLAGLSRFSAEVPSLTALLSPTHIGAAVEAFRRIERLGEPLRQMAAAVELVEQFDRRWQNEALYFIVSGFLTVCGLWEMQKLASLDREEVEQAVLLALEAVLGDGTLVVTLREEVARAPYINSSQRTNLDHALEHAARGEYVHACASLYWGLEGAFWEVGYATAAVTLQRTDPKKTTRPVGFESMVKRLKLGPEMKTFVVRGLYGTTGNTYRHGGADSGERRQVLLGVAALTGWLEEFAGVQALTALVTATGAVLPTAIEQVLQAPRQLGP